jgi:hypothetical protein
MTVPLTGLFRSQFFAAGNYVAFSIQAARVKMFSNLSLP